MALINKIIDKLSTRYAIEGLILTVTKDGNFEWKNNGSISAVQSDWNQTDSTQLDYIKNKPAFKTDYVHTQGAAALVWTVKHDLGYMPNVIVKDSAGTTCVGEINYVDTNKLTITFSGEMSGKAYCS